MIKRLIVINILVLSYFSFAQTPLAKQSFEGLGDTWMPIELSTPSCNSNGDIWAPVTSIFSLFPSEGNRFWGIRDLDGNCGGNNFETITLPNIAVSGQTNLIFSFDYYAEEFDNGEALKYELFFDNVSQGEVIVVEGSGGNSDDTNGWKTETVSIPDNVSNVSAKFFAKCDHTFEIAGFDNIKIEKASGSSCNAPVALSVYEIGGSVGNEITGDTSLTTPSNMSSTPCDQSFLFNYNYDLFYAFTVPQGENSINVLTGGQNGSTIKVAVWDSCNGNVVFCSNQQSTLHTIDGLNSNTNYILQVWHDVSFWSNNSGPFTIVLEKTPPAPDNNNCFDATELIVGESDSENIITATNVGANNSGEQYPSCANYNGSDVWFTAQIPASGILTVETQDAGDDLDTGIAIYTGSCGNLTEIACNDDISRNNLYSQIELTGYSNTTVYIRAWTYNNATHGNFNIVAYTEMCPYTTRWNGSRWNNGIPNAYTSAVINGDYDTATNGSLESCNCTIANNVTVNVAADHFITVHNNFTVDGTLEVRNEGSLVMTNNNAVIDVTGTVNIHKTTTTLNNYRDFTYWSSPVTNAAISDVFTGVNLNRVFYWKKPGTNFYGSWYKASGNMQAGNGYISEAPNTIQPGQQHSIVFTGIPNNGVIPVELGHAGSTEDFDGFNLVGNPYPSAINVEDFINTAVEQSTESNLDVINGTIWLWTHNTAISNGLAGEFLGDDYATVNLSGGTKAGTLGKTPDFNIASGQGFYVKAEKSGTIYFDNAMRINEEGMNDLFFREQEQKSSSITKNRIWLNLESAEGGAFNQILLGFFDKATDGFDKGYDGLRFSAGWVSFYSLIDDTKYAIQGLGKFNDQKQITLGFDTYISRPMSYEISIADIEGDDLNNSDIILVDNLLNITHNLKEGNYQFSTENSGNFADRFTLKFVKTTLDIEEEPQESIGDLVIADNENNLELRSDKTISNVIVYDLLGRSLINKSSNNTTVSLPTYSIKNGTALLINVQFEDNTITTKKIILQ
ncbi:MAG: hypothetical protein R2821_04880 [Flavobacteriaceae bacterium]